LKRPNSTVILFGPTGVGKTSLLTELDARRFEIISADSLQVYRGMDIGTAKPTKEQQKAVPHHLIDICSPSESFDLGRFNKLAGQAVEEILQNKRLPIISGGTGYYIKHFVLGMPETPKASPSVRIRIEAVHRRYGTAWCHERLAAVDPVSAARISSNDAYRILRALEVYEATGKPLSSFSMTRGPGNDLDFLIIGLYRDREDLFRRINLRVDEMFRAGLVEEIRELMRAGAQADWPGMKGIGYREFFISRRSGEFSYRQTGDLIKQASKAYAKRQMTFFRSIPGVIWLNPESDRAEIIRLLHSRY
jgi:tRNA dimethylallyltransferase